METEVFIVTAYRYGDKESHSYVVGVFEDASIAITEAFDEEENRGRKYECEVIKVKLNEVKKREIILPLEEY